MSKVKKLASGVGWGALSTVAVTGFQLVFMAIMARLLEPSDFGLVAIANVSLRFFSYFAQLGTAPALIQKPELEKGDIAAAMTVSLSISSLFIVFALLSAPFFEMFYMMPGLADVIQVLAINFLVTGFAAVSIGLLRRNTAFRVLSMIDVVAYVTGYGVVGLTCAYEGLGVWALVAAFMTQNTLSAILSYCAIRHPLSFKHSRRQRRHFLSYGSRYSLIGFLEFLASNLDSMVIGKLLGATPAGHYNRAMLLANLPVQQPANILTKALFPIMSSVGDQLDKQKVSLHLGTLLVGGYAFAVSAGIYLAATDIVGVLLGKKWLEAIPILQTLVLAVGPSFINHIVGVTMDSMNRLRAKLRIQFSMLLLLVGFLIYWGPRGNAVDIAWAIVATEWTRLVIMTIYTQRLFKTSAKELLMIYGSIAIITLASGETIWLGIYLCPNTLDQHFRLAIEIVAGGAGLFAGLLVARNIFARLLAMQFLAQRVPKIAKLLPQLCVK